MNADACEKEPWEIDFPEREPDFLSGLYEDDSSRVRETPDSPSPKLAYDLAERTAKFGEAVIDFLKTIPLGPRTDRLVGQLTGCGTSVGANYCEADDATSRKEFILKINTCRKEARESKYFIRMIARAIPECAANARVLYLEAQALHLIFAKIRRTALSNQ